MVASGLAWCGRSKEGHRVPQSGARFAGGGHSVSRFQVRFEIAQACILGCAMSLSSSSFLRDRNASTWIDSSLVPRPAAMTAEAAYAVALAAEQSRPPLESAGHRIYWMTQGTLGSRELRAERSEHVIVGRHTVCDVVLLEDPCISLRHRVADRGHLLRRAEVEPGLIRSAPMTDTPSTAWREAQAEGEEARFEEHAKRLVTLQRSLGGASRALHAKGHGVFEASLEIVDGLPEHASHGLFAESKRFEALVRFSNGSGKRQADKVGDVRGIAVKVLGVEGKKVLGDAATQDLLAILSPAVPFRNADEFVAVVWGTRSPPLALFRLIGALGLRAIPLLRKLLAGFKAPQASLAAKRFYSALPIQCGPYAVRFAFTPREEAAEPLGVGPDFHAEALAARLRRGPVTYDLELQFFVDEATTPIEDPTVDWPTPYIRVGKLELPQQDAASERGERIAQRGERLSFDPWHALTEHRPLGNMMRARKHAYYASVTTRGAEPEPDTIAGLIA